MNSKNHILGQGYLPLSPMLKKSGLVQISAYFLTPSCSVTLSNVVNGKDFGWWVIYVMEYWFPFRTSVHLQRRLDSSWLSMMNCRMRNLVTSQNSMSCSEWWMSVFVQLLRGFQATLKLLVLALAVCGSISMVVGKQPWVVHCQDIRCVVK